MLCSIVYSSNESHTGKNKFCAATYSTDHKIVPYILTKFSLPTNYIQQTELLFLANNIVLLFL